MSIAISVVVQPSRSLTGLELAVCVGVALLGLAFGAGLIGNLPFWLRGAAALVCLPPALAAILQRLSSRKIYHIDISDAGQIRLQARSVRRAAEIESDAELVELLADSTLWPRLLVLRLRSADGKVRAVPVAADSLPPESFRALAVACRWIVADNLHMEHDRRDGRDRLDEPRL